MPLTTIDLRAGTTDAPKRKAISDAIHRSMIDVLGIPEDDRFHVFNEVTDGSFFHEDLVFGKPRSDRMMFVTFSFNQRTPEQKEQLYATLVRHLEEMAGVPSTDVLIRVLETASENWWADGRVVNPRTGYDERMSVNADGSR